MESDKISDSPLMTDTQLEVLATRHIDGEPADDDERQRQYRAMSNLRTRLRDITADYTTLLALLDAGEIRTIFEDLESYRDYQDRVEEARRKAMEERGQDMVDPETGEVIGRSSGMFGLPEQGFQAEEGEPLREGIINALAFYYLGVGDREEFSVMIEQAIDRANRVDDRMVKEVDVSIDMSPLEVGGEDSREALKEAFLNDELDRERAVEILSAEPGLLIDMMFDELGADEDGNEDEDES